MATKRIGYIRATKDGEILWGEDCICQDPVYPVDGDDRDDKGRLVVSRAVYIKTKGEGDGDTE